jgi:hypothetical protein
MTVVQLRATENQEQRALVKWIRTQRIFDGLLIKLNNEGKRSEGQGWNLKLMGMEPGAFDLFLAYPTKTYHGLWIEVKQNRKYSPSEMAKSSFSAQLKFGERMISVGFAAHFCYGWEDGKKIIEDYISNLSIA